MRRDNPIKKNSMLKDSWSGLWDRYNLLEKKLKKQPDLIKVKIPKLVSLIIKPRYFYRKQIIIDYEVRFSTDSIFNDEIEKKIN